ncbi:MAG: hypothetical protein WC447_03195 [Candidatus Paceibacterota bacterium]|jgi:hypothetical protein
MENKFFWLVWIVFTLASLKGMLNLLFLKRILEKGFHGKVDKISNLVAFVQMRYRNKSFRKKLFFSGLAYMEKPNRRNNFFTYGIVSFLIFFVLKDKMPFAFNSSLLLLVVNIMLFFLTKHCFTKYRA